jgi:hypothetical protein
LVQSLLQTTLETKKIWIKKTNKLNNYNKLDIEHPFFTSEIERQEKAKVRYDRLKDKHQDKPKEWWFDTHGIDLDEMED